MNKGNKAVVGRRRAVRMIGLIGSSAVAFMVAGKRMLRGQAPLGVGNKVRLGPSQIFERERSKLVLYEHLEIGQGSEILANRVRSVAKELIQTRQYTQRELVAIKHVVNSAEGKLQTVLERRARGEETQSELQNEAGQLFHEYLDALERLEVD